MGGGGQTQATTIPQKTARELELEQLNLETARQQSQGLLRAQALADPATALESLGQSQGLPGRITNPLYTEQQALKAWWQSGGDVQLPDRPWGSNQTPIPGFTQGDPTGSLRQRRFQELEALQPPQLITNPATGPYGTVDSPAFRQQLQDVLDQQARDRALLAGPAGAGAPGAPGTSGLALSQAEQDLIAQQFAAARTTGEQDIRRFAEQLGGQRGLRLTDTPIGAEALRQQGRLATELRGGEAGTTLNLNVQSREFQEGLRRFQQGLLQQATQNRMALSGLQPPGIGLGLNFGFQERGAQSTTATSLTQPFAQTFGQVLGGAGGAALGLGLGFGGRSGNAQPPPAPVNIPGYGPFQYPASWFK